MSFANNDNIVLIIITASACMCVTLCYFLLRIYIVNKFFSKIINFQRFYVHILIHFILIVSIIIMFSFLLLQPRWGTHMQQVNSHDADLIVVLDVSRSMLVKEKNETRLERAKRAALYAVSNFKGRIGLVVFAGDAFMQSPLTTDQGAFKLFLDAVSVDSIELQGTNISSAIKEASRVFEKKKISKKIVLLITDGEEHESSLNSIIKFAKKNEITINTASVGSDIPGTVPTNTDDENPFHDRMGRAVSSKTDRYFLKSLASSTSGVYVDVDSLLAPIRMIGKSESDSQSDSLTHRYIEVPDEKYYVFSAIIVLLLLIELLFTSRKVLL